MTVPEAKRALERIAVELDRSIDQLVDTPTAVDQWPVTIRTTLDAVVRIDTQFFPAAGNETFKPMVQRLQNRVQQLQALLESAALFYCGCVAVTSSEGTGYTYGGALEQSATGGRMQLEA